MTAIPPEYATWLGVAEYIAQNGIKRDREAGGSFAFTSTGTKGPGDFGAMQIVERERDYMRRRAAALKRALRSYVDGEDPKKEIAE